jgi:hypothetical protein
LFFTRHVKYRRSGHTMDPVIAMMKLAGTIGNNAIFLIQ